MSKPQYAPSNAELDLKRRQENGNTSDRVLSTADEYKGEEAAPDKDGYVGVDPVYQTAADLTQAPGVSTEGPEGQLFSEVTGNESDIEPTANTPESVEDAEDDEEEDGEPDKASTTSLRTSSTPPPPAN